MQGGWGLTGGACPTWPGRYLPHSVQPGQQGCQGQSGLARNPSGLPLSSAPTLACLIPGGPSTALATPGSLLYIFQTSFYSL